MHVVSRDNLDSEGLHLVERADDDFFGELVAVKCET